VGNVYFIVKYITKAQEVFECSVKYLQIMTLIQPGSFQEGVEL
jgi:hypothetical protein